MPQRGTVDKIIVVTRSPAAGALHFQLPFRGARAKGPRRRPPRDNCYNYHSIPYVNSYCVPLT